MAELSAELVQNLARRKGFDQPVVTLYLNTDGRENIRPEDYHLHLEALIREAMAKSPPPSAVSDLERIQQFVAEEFERGNTRGLAIFASGDKLWEIVPLPVPIDDHLVVNLAPHVRRLEMILDEYEPCGVLITDKQRARLLVVELGRVVASKNVDDPLPRHDDDKGDWRKDHVKTHSEAVASGHLRHVAQEMFEMHKEHPFNHLVLGVADELRNELERNLHSYLVAKVCGRANLSVSSSTDDIVSTAHEICQRAERKREGEFVDKLRAGGVAGASVTGLEPTLTAVFEKRVDTLLVSEGYVAEGWRCTECTYIATVGRRCRMCGATMTLVDDVIEEAVEDALGQKCRVEFCSDNADLDVMGRIGALLRF